MCEACHNEKITDNTSFEFRNCVITTHVFCLTIYTILKAGK